MAKYGIYVPSRDAAWEESDAFSELLEQYNKCDFLNCKCKKGRHYHTLSGYGKYFIKFNSNIMIVELC